MDNLALLSASLTFVGALVSPTRLTLGATFISSGCLPREPVLGLRDDAMARRAPQSYYILPHMLTIT